MKARLKYKRILAGSIILLEYNFVSGYRSSVVSSAQQVQRFTFSSRSSSLVEESTGNQLQDEVQDIYAENDSDVIGPDGSRRSSDLYSPELNLEAHRTAQEVRVDSKMTLKLIIELTSITTGIQ